MTDRQRILAAIRGETPDRLPWVPRLDFWHRARVRSRTLPAELSSLSLVEIADRLGVGCYSTIPDFTDCRGADDMIDRALGIYRLPVFPYRVMLEGVERRVTRCGHETVVEYETPLGRLRTATVFTEEMLAGGASMSWVTEHAIKEPRDFEIAGYVFSHLKVEPQWDGYRARCREVGERGLVVGYLLGTASPMHHIMKELMTLEQFFYALHDDPEQVQALAEQIEPLYIAMKRIAVGSPAEVILLGANYDDSITYPAFFQWYILPSLRSFAESLHRNGKYLMTHTDGENRRLLPLYQRSGFDVADSVCPYPMTQCTLEEIRAAFADRITIWGGIPSILLCPTSTPWPEFKREVDALVERYRGESRFILGVSDMVTADAEWGRLQYITEKVSSAP